MTFPQIRSFSLCVCFAVASTLPISGQTPASRPAGDKAAAYYHFSLGHLYAELAAQHGNRGEYLAKAIENYKLAMKADPQASFLAEELSDLYVQAGRLREAVTEAEETLKANPNDLNSRRILGRIYTRMIGDSQQGKIDERMLSKAIEQYDKLTEIDKEDTDALLTLGRLHKVAQNSTEAEKAYKRILAVEPENEDALMGLAIVYSDLGDTKRSAELLQQVTNKNPSVRTLMALASQYEQLRDHALAAETLRKTIELAPDNVEAKRAYAQNLFLADNFDEALKAYSELAAEDPKDPTAYLRISQIHLQKRDFAKAREAAEKAMEIDPNALEVRYNRVSILEGEGKTPEAISALNEILSSTSKRNYSAGERNNRIALLERLGMLYRNSEQTKEAIDTYRQIADLDANSASRSAAQIADTYRIAKDYNKALDEANAGLKKVPNDRVLKAVRASILAELGKTSEAVTDLKSLLDGKSDRETYISLAQVYEKAKDYGEMAKAIDAAGKLSQSKEQQESVVFMRGAMYEKQKKYDAAEAEFRRVIEMNPKNASALNYLGYMLADRAVRVPEALEMIKQALEIDPGNGAYLDSLGWAYFRLNDLEKAEKYLVQAIEKTSKDPTVHDHLGDVYAKQGRLKDAIEQWQKSLVEWEHSSPADVDTNEVAKVQKKLDSAKVRLAQESSGSRAPKQQ